jgi:hypothetical protein
MSPTETNPRLNTNMDALLSKLYSIHLLERPRFQIYLISSLTDYFFKDSPRELFELLMKLEYSWRLALHAPYGEENEVILSSVVGYNENVLPESFSIPTGPVHDDGPNPIAVASSAALLAQSAGGPPYDQAEEIADQYYSRGWNEGRNALREEILGPDAKKAIQELIINHRLKKSASGRLVCACNRGSEDAVDWSIHVRVRIMNYLRNEFISQADARDKA